jgi:hypothetical protein
LRRRKVWGLASTGLVDHLPFLLEYRHCQNTLACSVSATRGQGAARFTAWNAYRCVLWIARALWEILVLARRLRLNAAVARAIRPQGACKWLCYNRDFNIIWRGS